MHPSNLTRPELAPSSFFLAAATTNIHIMLSIPGPLLLSSPCPSHSHLMSRKYRRKLKMSPFKNLIISSTPRFSLIVESSWMKDESFSWHEVYSMQDSTEPGQSGHAHILSASKKHCLEDNSYKFIVFKEVNASQNYNKWIKVSKISS